jgi:hypothetical protein
LTAHFSNQIMMDKLNQDTVRKYILRSLVVKMVDGTSKDNAAMLHKFVEEVLRLSGGQYVSSLETCCHGCT